MKSLAKIAVAAVTLAMLMTGLALEAQAQPQPATYQMSIRTGDRSGAGTDSNIYVTLYGTKGKTREIRLNGYIKGDAFERGDLDHVRFAAEDVGDLKSILVRSDNKYLGSAWMLEYMDVRKLNERNKRAMFSRWLETGQLSATAPLR